MSTNVFNPQPYLRTSREFPEKMPALTVQIDKAYVDTANCVNDRIIGIFATNRPSITGEQWYLAGGASKQQTLRQVYRITGAGNYAHGINTSAISGFTAIYGTATDGTSWYPLPYVNAVAANNQIALSVTATNIVVTAGAGAPPAITSGFVILEWLSNS